jgi:hypothetical protein
MHGVTISAGFLRQRARQPRFADAAGPGDQKIAVLGNPSCWNRALSSRRGVR